MIAFVVVENVNDDISVVENDPVAFRAALSGVPFYAVILVYFLDNLPADGFQVWVGGSTADHKVVSDCGNPVQIEDCDVLGLLFVRTASNRLGECKSF